MRLLGDFHIRAQLDESWSMVVWGWYTPYITCHQYAIYYIFIIWVSSGEGWDGSGEAGAEGHRQLGHRHGRQPPHGQVTRRHLTSSHHCFTSLVPQVFCDSLHHLCLHHSYEDNCLFHCYGKNVFCCWENYNKLNQRCFSHGTPISSHTPPVWQIISRWDRVEYHLRYLWNIW